MTKEEYGRELEEAERRWLAYCALPSTQAAQAWMRAHPPTLTHRGNPVTGILIALDTV